MKRLAAITIWLMLCLFMAGCAAKKGSEDLSLLNWKKTVGKDIPVSDITDFYYTVENINYNAFYQRYRFYTEDGKYLFFHDTRERKDDYGPATEEDRTNFGTIELTEEQWAEFCQLVSGGTVKARGESTETGDSGPWLYLYWKNDKSKYQQFSFDSYGTLRSFEDYCRSLSGESSSNNEDGSGGEGTEAGTEAGTETGTEVAAEARTTAVTGPYGQISVNVPEHWSAEAVKVDEGKLTYGLYGVILKPEDAEDGQIEVFISDSFGVCGTGLASEEKVIGDQKVTVGTYDNHEHWDFIYWNSIVFDSKNKKPQVIAQHTNCDSWSEEMWEEADKILETVFFDKEKAEGGVGQYIADSENDAIGVMMDVRHVTPTGLTVHFRQYDKRDTGELVYGEGYTLERLNGDAWEAVPTIIENPAFTDIGYIIPPKGESEIETNWEWLYGTLPPGTYKITKLVRDGKREKTADYNPAYPMSAQFMLAGE